MAIGRTLKASLQKALSDKETGRFGIGCDRADRWGLPLQPGRDEILAKLATPNAERVWYLRYALKAGLSVEDIYQRTKIDRWFLHNLRDLVEMEDQLRKCPGLSAASTDLLLTAKQHGFSDRQLSTIWGTSEAEVRRA